MKKSLSVVWTLGAALFVSSCSIAQEIALPTANKKPAAQFTEQELRYLGEGVAFPYELLGNVLKESVDTKGDVDYAKVKGNNELDTFVRAVAIADLSKFPEWTVVQQPDEERPLAKPKEFKDQRPLTTFWINAYNGIFLKTIADAYPIKSPGEIANLHTAKTRTVGGKTYSFEEMRKIIAALDPRAVFALTDGTRNGPRLQPFVYRFASLDPTLNEVVRAFVNDYSRVKMPDRLGAEVEVSPWLKDTDPLIKKSGRRKFEGIRSILAGYTARGADRNYFATGEYTIDFLPSESALAAQTVRN